MIAPAPREPSANHLDRRYMHYLAGNEAALDRSIARYVRVKRREAERAEAAGEVADPPSARPVTRRTRRKP